MAVNGIATCGIVFVAAWSVYGRVPETSGRAWFLYTKDPRKFVAN